MVLGTIVLRKSYTKKQDRRPKGVSRQTPNKSYRQRHTPGWHTSRHETSPKARSVKAATPTPRPWSPGSRGMFLFLRNCFLIARARGPCARDAHSFRSYTGSLVRAGGPVKTCQIVLSYLFSKGTVVSFKETEDNVSTFVVNKAGFYLVRIRLVVGARCSFRRVHVFQLTAQTAQALAQPGFGVPLDRFQAAHHCT